MSTGAARAGPTSIALPRDARMTRTARTHKFALVLAVPATEAGAAALASPCSTACVAARS